MIQKKFTIELRRSSLDECPWYAEVYYENGEIAYETGAFVYPSDALRAIDWKSVLEEEKENEIN